jgi:hypothetical protein
MPRPLFLTRRRLQKSLPHPLSDSLFCSKPNIPGAKSWEYFHPDERARIVVEKLCIVKGVRPPGFRNEYRAIAGCIKWLSEWEQAILCDESLWSIHCKFADFLVFLRQNQLPEDIDLLLDGEYKTFHRVLDRIREYPLLASRVQFCNTEHVRDSKQCIPGGDDSTTSTTQCSTPTSSIDSVCSSCYHK